MKVYIVQPYYSFEEKDRDVCYDEMMKLVDGIGEDADIIVMPEYCDIPSAMKNAEGFNASMEKYNSAVYEKASETAKRCNALVFANFGFKTEKGYRNTTYAFNRNGELIGKYFKAHPAPSEYKTKDEGGNEMDCSYAYAPNEPYILEIEGIRYGFMTCYDFYMYENYARLAREKVDIIIGCSHQRTYTHNALDLIGRFLSYNTNAYLIRSSVSLGENSDICGCSMVVSPKGEMILNMKSKIGIGVAEIDPKEKYYKPAGFKGSPKSHYEYIEEGRRPWLYRNGGASVVLPDTWEGYPRLCAHMGFNTVAPENSMPAFGAAIALGAKEIEFDVWASKDGVLVSCHDETLERVSDGKGKIGEKTYDELKKLDFGIKHGDKFKGLKIPTFEEILQKFAARVIMNIHVKIWDSNADDDKMDEIVALVKKYDCEKYVYFMTASDEKIKKLRATHPEMRVCTGWNGNPDPMSIAERAIALKADKVQLFKP
ncbi:MAG: hypothetical protein IJS67_02665, partial [Clostridia bacterium]|nr:hypothetical protein [Clostridia bacterium]